MTQPKMTLLQNLRDLERNLLTRNAQDLGRLASRMERLLEAHVLTAQRFLAKGKPQGTEMCLESLAGSLADLIAETRARAEQHMDSMRSVKDI